VTNTPVTIEITKGQREELNEVKKFLSEEYKINPSYKDVIMHLYRFLERK